MDLHTEMDAELASRLMVASNSTLFTAARITALVNQATLIAESFHEWPETVRAKITSTVAGQDYYDYPEEFRTDTAIRVEIGGVEYNKKNFEDFMDFKIKYATSLNTVAVGTNNLDIWGCIQPELLTTTIFSYHASIGNEAIVKLALSVAMAKINKDLSIKEEFEAKMILENLWKPIARKQAREQRLDHPMFNVPDFFGPTKISDVDDRDQYIFADYQRKIFIASFNF